MRDGTKLWRIVGLLFVSAFFAGCAITPVDGVRWCIVSVIPLEPLRGGTINMTAGEQSNSMIVEIAISNDVYKADVDIYDPTGSTGTKWIDGSTASVHRLVLTPGSSNYDVMLQVQSGGGIWKNAWSKAQVYPLQSVSGEKGSWTLESKATTSGKLDDTYWLSFGNGRAGGLTVSGYLQDLE